MGEYNKPRRVVVTGIGTISSLGIGIDAHWNNLIQGNSGIKRVSRFDPSDFPSQVGSEVIDFEVNDYMDPKEARRNDRFTHFAVACSRIALDDARIDTTKLDPDRFGVMMASGIGGMETIQKQSHRLFKMGPRKVSPFMIPSLIANIASGIVAIEHNARGPNYAIVSACSSSTHSIGESWRIVRDGDADIMIAGGSEAAITDLGYAGFCSMKAMSTRYNDEPSRASRPFEKGRDGFVMGEGAGVLILESLDHAQARGARVYAEVASFAATCDAYHITSPDPEGKALTHAMKKAIRDAGMQPEDLDYINAHGTSTPYNDKFETLAIKQALGDEQARRVMISSTKSMTGHLLGAAGGVECAACCKAIEEQIVPPTINYEVPDEDCDLNYTPNEMRRAPVRSALCNNSGFGGHNASVLFKRFE